MADTNKVDISFDAQTRKASGDVRKFKGEFESLGTSGKRAAATITGSFRQIETAIGKVRKLMSTVSFATLWIAAIAELVAKFREWRKEAKGVTEQTKELQKAASDKAAAAAIRAVTEEYKALGAAIDETNRKKAREKELFDEQLRVRREAEDAAIDAEEAEALAAVDPNAENADKQRSAIRDRFSAERARRNSDRKLHDVVNRRADLERQAAGASSAADALEGSLSSDDSVISRTRLRANTLEALSREHNDKDGTWWDPRRRTAAGDEERERQRKEAEALRAEVKRLEADRKAKERQIAELREQAAHATAMHDALGTAISTAERHRSTTLVRNGTAEGIRAAEAQKDAEKTREAERLQASALAARQSLSAERDSIKERLADEQAKKDAAGLAVYQAQGAYDAARLAGRQGAIKSAHGQLQAATVAAQNVDHAADTAINALVEALNGVEQRLKAASSYLEKTGKQQRAAWEEAPAGQ